MAFVKEQPIVPESIGDIEVRLFYPDPNGNEQAGAKYSVQVRYSDGSMQVRQGDLVPHITQQQINGLMGFMETLRTKAIAEFIGE